MLLQFGVRCPPRAGGGEAMRDHRVLFSSSTDLWATPQDFFDTLHREFRFGLDVCAIPENAKCAAFYTPTINGLAQHWRGVCWMNPPYGRDIGLWMRKAHESSLTGATVVCLVPARTDTAWWHDYAARASEIRFLRGRLKFGDSRNSAPFPSAVVVFRPPKRKSLNGIAMPPNVHLKSGEPSAPGETQE
jgi:phage N-6-adenine-methyltransferase